MFIFSCYILEIKFVIYKIQPVLVNLKIELLFINKNTYHTIIHGN